MHVFAYWFTKQFPLHRGQFGTGVVLTHGFPGGQAGSLVEHANLIVVTQLATSLVNS